MRELIHGFKYQSNREAIAPLTKIMNLYLDKVIRNLESEIGNSAIIPVPLYPSKERKRGFNQAKLIAEVVQRSIHSASLIGPISPVDLTSPMSPMSPINPMNPMSPMSPICPIITDVLIRIKNTASQTELKDIAERITNIQGCFKITNPEKIKGKNVLLVDDVFTSGATMTEAVQVLKKAGVKKIIGFVMAKT